MVEATWDDWFVTEEIEGIDPDGLSLWYLGCNGFVLRTRETTLFIDPYFGTGEHRPYAVRMLPVPIDPETATDCDGVLVTHEHVDHMHPPSHAPLLDGTEGNVYAPNTCFESPDYSGDLLVSDENRVAVTPGSSFEVGDLTVQVRDASDPDAREAVSYVIESPAGTFFHPGDARNAPIFQDIGKAFDIDIGAFAYGSKGTYFDPDRGKPRRVKWYMNGDEVIDACDALQLNRLLPTHYDMWKGFQASPCALYDHASSAAYPRAVTPIEVGDRVDLGRPGVIPPCYTRQR